MAEQPKAEMVPAAKSEKELGEFLENVFLNSATLYCISLGSHVGLFDTMAEFDEPATSQEIADKGNYKERYVREWLSSMVASGLVSVDTTGSRFLLPQSHRSTLCGQNTTTLNSTILTLTPISYKEVAECFKKDGPLGIDFQCLTNAGLFSDYMAIESNLRFQWDNWKTEMEKVPGLLENLEKGIKVLEVGCHRSENLINLAQRFPKSEFTGIDICTDPLNVARLKIQDLKLTNITILDQDVYKMPTEWTELYEYIFSVDVIHDLPYVVPALSEMKRVLKKGSFMSVYEINGRSKLLDNLDNPMAKLMYCFSLFYCMPQSLNAEGADGIGTLWGQEMARDKMREAGLEVIKDNPYDDYIRHYIHIISSWKIFFKVTIYY